MKSGEARSYESALLDRDPDDDKILACAQQVHADYIVTGDQDLLVLERYVAIPIVTPRDFESLFTA